MDPREQLMAMQQGGGGGGEPQMPQGGGDPRMAQAMQQKLAQLMQDPVARAGMQAHMQGGDPRAAGARIAVQQGPPPGMMGGAGQGGFSGPTTDGSLYAAQEANQGVRGNLPRVPDTGGMTGYAEDMEPMPEGRQTPMPGRRLPEILSPNRGEMGPFDRVQSGGPGAALWDMVARGRNPEGDSPETDMVSKEIDRKGATFDGTDAPTANDIERLREAPTDTMVEAFDAQFGDGASAKYMDEEKGEPAGTQDEGDHEYR